LYLLYTDIRNGATTNVQNLANSVLSLVLNLALCAPWRWYTCTEACRSYNLNIYVYLILCSW